MSGVAWRRPWPASWRLSRPRRAWSRNRPTSELIRVAGSLALVDGARLTWSVADGNRGRRWRAVSIGTEGITHALLLEVDPTGRPSRLELTTAAGLLTLHPSADQREIHGNVVTTTGEGVRPLAFAWGPEHELEVIGRPLASAVAVHRRRSRLAIGASEPVAMLSIGPELQVVAAERTIERLTETRWRVGTAELEIDADGLPTGGDRWPLEIDE
ncbi:MAG TPA: hypothetical protein VKR24_06790 [Candidatus Limnocylindrales bacterium]|nr:hypothetical protein [Candidatus Limnocylindrales bacterium]